MSHLPLVITFRLDDTTRARIHERVGRDQPIKNLSQFIREAISLRLAHADPSTAWSIQR
jgi:Arc/MetJ-type ribon-helix-helix transcriptional regulator